MKIKIPTLSKSNQNFLQTVLESPSVSHEEENDIWSHTYMLPGENDHGAFKRWGQKRAWCKPSCIPITVILILIFLVVLLPLLDHAMERAEPSMLLLPSGVCQNPCSISLVESIPEGLVYPNDSTPYPSTYQTWLDLINSAQYTIEIGSFYWTLRQSEVYPDPSSAKGEEIFQALLHAGKYRGIKVKIAQNAPTQGQPNTDTEYLVKRKAAEVRSLNFAQLLGGGVLHTKLWIIDRIHFYVGSANMDWRSLTQVKEMGVVVRNCSCLTDDVAKIFDVYWSLGEKGAKVPDHWPSNLETKFNIETPMNLTLHNDTFQTYLSSSPPPFSPLGRSDDIDAVINVIQRAEKFIYIAVMDYFPLTIYTPKVKFWPEIDNALRAAAVEHKVNVKLLISKWNHSRHSEDYFLKSLADITRSFTQTSIEVRHFIVPSTSDQSKIPFARVNHNKYMVTDNTAYIGTSNWSGDYFIDTAGIGLVVHDPMDNRNISHITIRSQLQAVFERDWNSKYAYPLS